jgi:hypothetical protein
MNPYWPPIETAPKDGTLLLTLADDKYYAVFWERHQKIWMNQDGFMVLPTHWIPLQIAIAAPALLGVVEWALNDPDSEILGEEWNETAINVVKKVTTGNMYQY